MRTLLLVGLLSAACFAQGIAPSVVVATTSTITATAGTVSCFFRFTAPAPPTGVRIECKSDTAKLTLDSVVPIGLYGLMGVLGGSGAEEVVWEIKQPTTGQYEWTVSAGGVTKSGKF